VTWKPKSPRSERDVLETGLAFVFAAVALAVYVYLVFGHHEVKPSVDVLTLYLKHAHECRLSGVDPMYHLPTEPLLTVINKLLPFCIPTYDAFSQSLAGIILLLHLLLFLQLRCNVARVSFVVSSAFLIDLYTQTHLFRQTAASYVFAIWWMRGGTSRSFLPWISLLIHNATFLLLAAYFFSRRSLSFGRRHPVIASALVVPLIFLGAYSFGLVLEMIRLRYGFAFFDRSFGVADTYVAAVYKYFIFAAVMGVVHFLATRMPHLLLLGAFGLIVLTAGERFSVDAELIFRVLVPFRYVFLPLLISIALSEILQHIAGGRQRPFTTVAHK